MKLACRYVLPLALLVPLSCSDDSEGTDSAVEMSDADDANEGDASADDEPDDEATRDDPAAEDDATSEDDTASEDDPAADDEASSDDSASLEDDTGAAATGSNSDDEVDAGLAEDVATDDGATDEGAQGDAGSAPTDDATQGPTEEDSADAGEEPTTEPTVEPPPSGEFTELCEAQCMRTQTLDCPNDLPLDACVADCVEDTALVAGCETEFVQYGECLTSDFDANFACDENGESGPVAGACQDELIGLAGCLQGSSESAEECAAYCEDDPLTPPISCEVEEEEALPCELGCQAVFEELGTDCGRKWMDTIVCAHGEPDHWTCEDTGAEFNFDEGVCVDEQTALTECQ